METIINHYSRPRKEFLIYSIIQNIVAATIELEEIYRIISNLLGEEYRATTRMKRFPRIDPIIDIEIKFRDTLKKLRDKIDLLKSYGRLATTSLTREQIDQLVEKVRTFKNSCEALRRIMNNIDTLLHFNEIRRTYNEYLRDVFSECPVESWQKIERDISTISSELNMEGIISEIVGALDFLIDFISRLFPVMNMGTKEMWGDRRLQPPSSTTVTVDSESIRRLESTIIGKIMECVRYKTKQKIYEKLTNEAMLLKQINRDIEKLLSMIRGHTRINVDPFKSFSKIVDELLYTIYEYNYLSKFIEDGSKFRDLLYPAFILSNIHRIEGEIGKLSNSINRNIDDFWSFLEDFSYKLYESINKMVEQFEKNPTLQKLDDIQKIFMYAESLLGNLEALLKSRRPPTSNPIEKLREIVLLRRTIIGSLLDTMKKFRSAIGTIMKYKLESIFAEYDKTILVKYQFEFFKELTSKITDVLLGIEPKYFDISRIEEIADRFATFIGEVIDYIIESGYFKRTVGIDWTKMFSTIMENMEIKRIIEDTIRGDYKKYEKDLSSIMNTLKETSKIHKYTNFKALLDASFEKVDLLEYPSLKYLWFSIVHCVYKYAKDRVNRAISSFMLVKRPVG